MNDITPFDFEGKPVRIVMVSGAPWFVLADVCRVLDHSDPSKAAERLDTDEKGTSSVRTPSGDQNMIIISESGLYSLILTSRKAAAKRFKKWVTAEVLPSIRKTGTHSVHGAAPLPPEDSAKAMNAAARLLGEMRRTVGNRAAAKAAGTVLRKIGVHLDPNTVPEALRQGGLFDGEAEGSK